MLTKRRICVAALLGLLLVFPSLAVAQQRPRPTLIKTSLTVDSDTLKRDKPATVTITVENISGRDIEIESRSSIELLSLRSESVARNHGVVGDGYWSPVNIATGKPLGVEVEPAGPDTVRFAKGETRTFKLDLTKTFWNDHIFSGWPSSSNLFEAVPKGSYTLAVRVENVTTGVKVSVE